MKFTTEQKIHYTLRIAAAMCFIGHGSFGIITKEVWTNYFAVFGISHDLSFRLMPLLGALDIFLGLIILFYPLRIALLWLVAWSLITALLRPLSGEPFAEFIERAGNFGAPLALLLYSGNFTVNIKTLFRPVTPNVAANVKGLQQLIACLRIIVFLLFLGHGWLNLIEKKSLVNQYLSLGFINAGTTAQMIGLFEITGAVAILIRPLRSVVLVFLVWKAGSELFYPHYEIFEWIERGGSYGALLALWLALDCLPAFQRSNLLFRNKLMKAYSRTNGKDYTK
ncbi:MAG: hypothetical protein M3Z92_16475 [Bacteroidota bacterium]|nr:hypothetical protein [Bacteroidota bacterium]